jgi:hypothetical protein
VSVPKFLVNQGASVLAKDKGGESPLQIASADEKELIAFLKAATKR